MNNFYLTPQYELFVEAKLVFIINGLMTLPMERLEVLQEADVTDAIDLFTELFSYHGTPYGTASAAASKQPQERTIYNARYALDAVNAAAQALAWNSKQRSLSGDMVRVLYAIFEQRLMEKTSPDGLSWSTIERVWRFLLTAPDEVLGIVGRMRYFVPVSPEEWRAICATDSGRARTVPLLVELFKDGFVWPNSPITFIPTVPFDQPNKKTYYVVVRPGNMQVSQVDDGMSRMELIYGIMRELFGHQITKNFTLPFGTDKAFAELSDGVEQVHGSWDKVPKGHILHAIRELLDDCRCTDNRLSYDGAAQVTYATLIEFMDRLRVYKEEEKHGVGINVAIQKFVDYIVHPNMSHFDLVEFSFPAFSKRR